MADKDQQTQLPAGYIMTAMGPQLDPNYRSPGRVGVSSVDQAAMQGVAALEALRGVIPGQLLDAAVPAAKRADTEGRVNALNAQMWNVQNRLKSPYLTADERADLQTSIAAPQQERAKLLADLPKPTLSNVLENPPATPPAAVLTPATRRASATPVSDYRSSLAQREQASKQAQGMREQRAANDALMQDMMVTFANMPVSQFNEYLRSQPAPPKAPPATDELVRRLMGIIDINAEAERAAGVSEEQILANQMRSFFDMWAKSALAGSLGGPPPEE